MINVIIAAGYATRLYPLTENFPKPLLKIGGSTILGRIMEDVDGFPEIKEHVIVTNHKFAHIFEEWKTTQTFTKPVTIIDDGTSTNETRLGAVRDLLLALTSPTPPQEGLEKSPLRGDSEGSSSSRVDDDVMVLAADNILDFSFRGFVDFFKEKQTSCIMCHHQPEIDKLRRTGVIVMDENNRVLNMEEKPQEPKSHWAVPPFYIYKKSDLPLILDCMNHGCGFDAPGNLAHYLCQVTPMHAWEMPGGRFDIGSLDTYEEAKRIYGEC